MIGSRPGGTSWATGAAVLLVQLGPGQVRDDARLDWFLGALPGWIRVAVEFRHPSWVDEDVFALLAAAGPPTAC